MDPLKIFFLRNSENKPLKNKPNILGGIHYFQIKNKDKFSKNKILG